MIIKLKEIYKKFLYGYKSSSKSYTKYLRKKGVQIGNNVTFHEPSTNYIDVQKPFLITIGNNVEITRGVIIITHDYSWSVLKSKYFEIIGSRKKVTIGNNVFIGMNTIILKGVTIGDNVIIGANSVVTKNIPSETVYCGSPAKKICTLDEYYLKRTKEYEKEAIELFIQYYNRYKKVPKKEMFDEFFWIFEKRNLDELPKKFIFKLKLGGNYDETLKKFLNTKPKFSSYESFVEECFKVIKNGGDLIEK